jgi:hypothetical protein
MWKLFLLTSEAAAFSMHVIGDWGRRGQFSQVAIANKMRSIAHDAVLSVGDNFYPDGLQTNEDEQIRESWLDIYSPDKPWYVALGNHDYHGNVNAQIAIDNPYWHMPSKVYNFSIQDHTFVVMDSTKIDKLQIDYVDSLLEHAGKYKWIVCHHPIVTAGWHHDVDRKYQDDLATLYRKHGVKAIISGHDHNLQYLEWNGIRQIISGAGSSTYHVQYPQEGHKFFESTPGFVNMLFSEDNVLVTFLNEDSELYTVYIPLE